jgi:FxLD family lantipeptide
MDPEEFNLDVRLVEAGPDPAAATEDCTSDNCGSGNTSGSACVTK